MVVEDKFNTALFGAKFGSPTFSEELASIKFENLMGYIDETGEIVIAFCFKIAYNFKEGLARVALFNFIEQEDNYDYDQYDEEPNIPVIYINKKGQIAFPSVFQTAHDFDNGLAMVCSMTGKWGYIDKNGQEVISCLYDDIGKVNEGLIKAKLNGKYGFIDSVGNKVIDFLYDNVGNFSESLAYVYIEGKGGGFINKNGNIEIPFIFDNCYGAQFRNGVCRITFNSIPNLTDKNGRLLVSLKYGLQVFHIRDNFAELNVFKGTGLNRYGYINFVTGREYWQNEGVQRSIVSLIRPT